MEKNKTIEYINIDEIFLDVTNPRLPRKSQEIANDEKSILKWMLSNGSLIELMISITENGYFDGEPILVVPTKLKVGYTVVEGNRRVSAVKILNNPQLVDKMQNSISEIIEEAKVEIPTKLPALVFSEESEILDYLGYRHITGVKQWSPLAKARYLDKLFKTRNGESIDEKYRVLAKIIGSKPAYTKRMHTTYRVYERAEETNFFGLAGISEESIEFSNLNDALTKFRNIGEYVGIDFDKLDPISNLDVLKLRDLFDWLFYRHPETYKTKVGEVRNLPKLNAILNSKNEFAYKAFVQDGVSIDKAFSLTDEPKILFTKSLKEAFEKLQTAQQLFYSIDEPKKEDVEILKRINGFSYDFYISVENKVSPIKKI